MNSFWLDTDRTGSVFTLFFIFIRDEQSSREELPSFDEALRDILMGVALPLHARPKLEALFAQVMEGQFNFYDTLSAVTNDFQNENEVLVAILRIVLRLAQDEGIVGRRDKERVQDLLRAFELDTESLRGFSDSELELLSILSKGGLSYMSSSRLSHNDLLDDYRVLGCTPGMTFVELKRAYRRLVKEYHPDKHNLSDDRRALLQRRNFEKVQRAFERIRCVVEDVESVTAEKSRSCEKSRS